MARKNVVIIMILILAVSFNLMAGNDPVREGIKFPFKGEGVGYVLLNWIITPMEKDDPARKWKGSIRELGDKLMKDAVSAKALGKIDTVFFDGFKRLMVVVRLNTIRKQLDYTDFVLEYHLLEELNRFRTRKNIKPGKETALDNTISVAVVDEILSLKKHLDDNAKKK